TLVRHAHVHCIVPAGGLSPDRRRWIRPKYAGFFLPVKVLSRVFRGSSWRRYARHTTRISSTLAATTSASVTEPSGTRSSRPSLTRTGSCTRSPLSVAPVPSYATSGAIRIAWPSAITGCSSSMATRDVSMEGLHPREPVPHDDLVSDGVSASFRSAHPAARLRPDSSVRVSRQH